MMKCVFLLIGLLSYYGCASRLEPDPALEAYIREILDNFKREMKNGIPALKVPPLEPLIIREKRITINEENANLNLYFPIINVRDLSTFSVPLLESNLDEFFLNLQLNINHVQLDGQYDLDGKVARIFPLSGNGNFQIDVSGVVVRGETRLNVRPGHLSIAKLHLDPDWGELTVRLDNFMGGGSFGQALQRMVPVIGKGIFNKFKPKILEELSNALTKEINAQLAKPEVQEIIKAIFPTF